MFERNCLFGKFIYVDMIDTKHPTNQQKLFVRFHVPTQTSLIKLSCKHVSEFQTDKECHCVARIRIMWKFCAAHDDNVWWIIRNIHEYRIQKQKHRATYDKVKRRLYRFSFMFTQIRNIFSPPGNQFFHLYSYISPHLWIIYHVNLMIFGIFSCEYMFPVNLLICLVNHSLTHIQCWFEIYTLIYIIRTIVIKHINTTKWM